MTFCPKFNNTIVSESVIYCSLKHTFECTNRFNTLKNPETLRSFQIKQLKIMIFKNIFWTKLSRNILKKKPFYILIKLYIFIYFLHQKNYIYKPKERKK